MTAAAHGHRPVRRSAGEDEGTMCVARRRPVAVREPTQSFPGTRPMLRVFESTRRQCLAALAAGALVLPSAQAQSLSAVRTAPLSTVTQWPVRQAPAESRARNETTLAAQVGGSLLSWRFDVGQSVRQGEVMARIDATDLRLARDQARTQVAQAKAQHELAKQQRERARSLQSQGFYSTEALSQSDTQFQLTLAQWRAAELQLRVAQRQLDKATVRAPFDGEVTQRMAQQGATVTAGSPLFALSETTGMTLHAKLSPSQAQDLSQASELSWVSGAQVHALQPSALRIAQYVDPQSRTQAVRAPLPPGVIAGRSGQLRWRSATPHVAAELLVRRMGQLGVFVVQDGRARFHPLQQAQEGQPAAIDLAADTLVVVQGQQRLQAGDPIAADNAAR